MTSGTPVSLTNASAQTRVRPSGATMFGEDRLHRLDVVGVDVVHERPGQQLLRVYPPCPLSASWTASTPSRGAACATYRTAAGPARTRQPAASGIAGTSKWYARQRNRWAGARRASARVEAGDGAGNAREAEPSMSHRCSGRDRRLRACINHRLRGTRLQSFRRSTRDD
jgi:hypothetical protein